jgi:hypothetical protein
MKNKLDIISKIEQIERTGGILNIIYFGKTAKELHN